MSYQNIIVETKGRVGIIRLNRPQQLNALNMALKAELGQAIDAYEADEAIGCLLITGNEKAFATAATIGLRVRDARSQLPAKLPR